MYTIISLIPTVIGALLALYLFLNVKKTPSNRFLAYAYITLVVSITTMTSYAYPEIPFGWLLDCICMFATLVSPVMLYLYACDLTKLKGASRRDMLFLLPAVLLTTADLVCYIVMFSQGIDPKEYLVYLYDNGGILSDAPAIYKAKRLVGSDLYRITTLIVTLGSIFFTYTTLKKYRELLDNYMSDIPEVTRKHGNVIVASLVLAAIGVVVFMSRTFSDEIGFKLWALFGSLCLTGTVVISFIFAVNHTYSISKLRKMIAEDDKRTKQNKREEKGPETIREKMDEALSKQFYLSPDVSLISLAESMNTNRTYISSFINKEFGCSFSDFVNGKRVEYAKLLIGACTGVSPDYDEIMRNSGFSSRQSFARNFTKFTGSTPAEYYKTTR